MKTSLIDADNPTIGVRMTYTGGDVCWDGRNRSFTITMNCIDDETVR